MRRLFIMMTYLFSVTAFSAPTIFDVNMELAIGEKAATSQRLSIEAGKKGIITNKLNGESSQIEVIVKEDDNKEKGLITMDFVISKIAKDGTNTILARPQMTTTPNDPVQINITKSENSEAISFSVLAKKVSH